MAVRSWGSPMVDRGRRGGNSLDSVSGFYTHDVYGVSQ